MEKARAMPDDAPAAVPEASSKAARIRVRGAVQGVGFRPFVHGLAVSLGLAGEVRNSPLGVEIDVEGHAATLSVFLSRLTADAPPLALIHDLSWESVAPTGRPGFIIAPSAPAQRIDTLVTADAATCTACLTELLDPRDRRYRYPFINCVDCGPRFTITLSVPYDRPATTMAAFEMCPDCEREYDDPVDRRFHAQPNACPVCGPRLSFGLVEHDAGQANTRRVEEGEEALQAGCRLLRKGGILAIKGIGGYHLACDATAETAVSRLRRRKHREERPLAVMAASVQQIRDYCQVSPVEEALLLSHPRPIVLLERRAYGAGRDRGIPALAEGVAPGVDTYGFLLPYSPLHHLLLAEMDRPLVMTSANLSEEPLAYQDDDARRRLSHLADGFLTHDRPIHAPVDDSVVREYRGRLYPLRRARGYAPLPVRFRGSDRGILALGGQVKSTFCLTRGELAFLSPHIGDLENLQTLVSLREGIPRLQRLFGLAPDLVAHDLHRGYVSTMLAARFHAELGLPALPVQHHEAHIAAVLADSSYGDRVVGLAFDGAGLGTDGTIWGGEFLVGDAAGFVRAAHLEHVPLLGGDLAARQPWRVAVALLDLVRSREGLPDEWLASTMRSVPGNRDLDCRPWTELLRVTRSGLTQPLTSSAGRLFDGVAAILGLGHDIAFEGQAAMLLEAAARRAARRGGAQRGSDRNADEAMGDTLPPAVERPGPHASHPMVVPVTDFVCSVLADVEAGLPVDLVALRFHRRFAQTCAMVARLLADRAGVGAVALSGGVFQNMLLLHMVTDLLEATGLRVLVHQAVPPNDGGLCLGQAEIAAARTGGVAGEDRQARRASEAGHALR